MLRIAVLATHPIQYQVPVYRELAKRNDVESRVFFCDDFGLKPTFDREFRKEIKWDVPLLGGYCHEFLPNLAKEHGNHHFFGLINPNAISRIAKFQPDLCVVSGYSHATELGLIALSPTFGIPVVIRCDSNLLDPRSQLVKASKQVLVRAIVSRLFGGLAAGKLNAQYLEHYGMPTDRIFTAPYCVDNDFFFERAESARALGREWRRERGISDNERVVLFAAKLVQKKACKDLIRAFKQCSQPNSVLVIVGDGPERTELEALASTCHQPVHFLGFVNQQGMAAAYAMADVFVLPSTNEPWGLAINEAMCMGLPIVASHIVGAVPDLVDAQNGWVFPAGNVDALTRVLSEALSESTDLKTRGRASLEKIRRWGVPENVDAMVAAAKVAKSSRRSARSKQSTCRTTGMAI